MTVTSYNNKSYDYLQNKMQMKIK